MQVWTETQARAALLPPSAKGIAIVLFVDDSTLCAENIARFKELVGDLALCSGIVARGDGSSEVARWFRINQFPAMAVIFDGMLLSVEYECSPGTCERVGREAIEQYRLFSKFESLR